MKFLLTSVILLASVVFSEAQIRFLKTVPTLTELVALNPKDIHTNVMVNSYWVSNTNSIGAAFQYVPGATDATNLYSVFKPTNYDGRWIRVEWNADRGGTTVTPVTEFHVSSSSTSSPRGIMSAQYSSGTDGARFHMRKARGTEASPTVVVTGDDLGRLQWAGYDGAAYQEMASIRGAVTGTVAAGRVPTQLIFSTATDASPSVLTDRLVIGPDGTTVLTAVSGANFTDNNGSLFRVSGTGAGKFVGIGFETTGKGYKIGVDSSDRLTIRDASANASRILITTTGEVGIGTTAPGSFGLAINHATGQSLDLIYNDSDGSPANHATLTVSSGGNLTIAPSGGLIQLLGTSSSFPAFKRSGTVVQFRLADDSAYGSAQLNSGFFQGNNQGRDTSVFGWTSGSDSSVSLDTGISRVSSGVIAFGNGTQGNVSASISAANGTFSGYIVGGVQSLSGAGAVNVTQAITEVTTTGAAQALTLADGVAGQRKTIIHGVDGGSAVLTPTTKTGFSTVTFTTAGESVDLVFLATRGWCVVGSYLAVIAP